VFEQFKVVGTPTTYDAQGNVIADVSVLINMPEQK
jgi:hypothetical protein